MPHRFTYEKGLMVWVSNPTEPKHNKIIVYAMEQLVAQVGPQGHKVQGHPKADAGSCPARRKSVV